jgi:twitching motility protein PilT
MSLKDLRFSDLILIDKGDEAYLKGTPDQDQKLVQVPDDCKIEAMELASQVTMECCREDRCGDSFRYTYKDVSYRVAVYVDVKKQLCFFLRRLADTVPPLESLNLPNAVADWLTDRKQCKGLILLAGGQGAGKTTTAASLIDRRLTLHGGHAVSFENPVEMPLSGPHGDFGYCFQGEISSESELESHIERAHRYGSPNIIYIGEIRSKYAASVALQVALGSSQQLVIATIHGTTIQAALTRLLTWAKEKDGDVACQNLAQTFLGIIRQELSDPINNKRELRLPEYLLLPYGSELATAVQAKIRGGNVELSTEINNQLIRLKFEGQIARKGD